MGRGKQRAKGRGRRSRGLKWGVTLFVLGVLTLSGSLLVSSWLEQVKVSAFVLKVGFDGMQPVVHGEIQGKNPFPVSVNMLAYNLHIGKKRLPAALYVGSEQLVVFPPGPFRVQIPVIGYGELVGVMGGDGFSLDVLKGVDYEGEMLLKIGPFGRSVEVDGVVGFSSQGGIKF